MDLFLVRSDFISENEKLFVKRIKEVLGHSVL